MNGNNHDKKTPMIEPTTLGLSTPDIQLTSLTLFDYSK